MRIEHTIPAGLLENRRVRVLVVGAGGTGSAIVMGLPYLDQAMRAWGHHGGLDVWMMDADAVSETNCIRQPFSLSDLGLNKATVLINRINLFWGTDWEAIPIHLDKRTRINDIHPDIVIGCVDTRAARRAIEEALKTSLNHTSYWLDLGNNAASGQYVLGQPLNARNHRRAGGCARLANSIPRSQMRRGAKIRCQAVQRSKRSTVRNLSSIKRLRRARSLCSRGYSVTAG